jgi:hypothetical protein
MFLLSELKNPLWKQGALIRTLLQPVIAKGRKRVYNEFSFVEKKCPARNSRASPLTIRNQDVYNEVLMIFV